MSNGLERRVSLEDWLKTIKSSEEYGVLSALKAHHWIQGNGGFTKGEEVVGRVYQQDKEWSPKDEAAIIRGRCDTYSQELPGSQTFKLFAYFGQAEATAWHHITCVGRQMMDGGLTETPDARGLVTQGMAMGNLVVSRTFGKDTELWNMTKFLLNELKEDRDYYAKEARDGNTIVLQLMREKIEDNHRQRMAELEFQRSTAERAKLIALLPAIIRYVTKGQNIIPDGMADTAILEAAAQEIRKMPKEDQLKTMSAFPQELMLIVGARLMEIAERQEKEEKHIELLSKARTAENESSDHSLALEILERAKALNGSAPKPQLPAEGGSASPPGE
jgi:hypothetical protein